MSGKEGCKADRELPQYFSYDLNKNIKIKQKLKKAKTQHYNDNLTANFYKQIKASLSIVSYSPLIRLLFQQKVTS